MLWETLDVRLEERLIQKFYLVRRKSLYPGSQHVSFRSRKNSFACRNAEKEQAQPQLYGTLCFFARKTPTGQLAHTANTSYIPNRIRRYFVASELRTGSVLSFRFKSLL